MEVPSISSKDFTAEVRCEGDRAELTIAGTADLRALKPLQELLQKLHDEIIRLGVAEIRVDVRMLRFMNSSCFKAFVSWLNRVRKLASDHPYRILFRANPDLAWQQRSLQALAAFAADRVSIQY